MRLHSSLLLFFALICGCAQVSKDHGFNEIQNEIEGRINKRVEWNQNTPEDQAVSDEITKMLAQELSCDQIVQI